MLESTESVTPEQVAMELLAVKTRLEASYAAMASISQLSLANYLK
jgi:flagellin-like hook-associated protein FlgL